MKSIVTVALASALVFAVAPRANAVEDCFDCVLGLYDDVGRTTVFGTAAPATLKSIYLGIDYSPERDRLLQIELSITGMRQEDGIFITTVDYPVDPQITLGLFPAPADTSATTMGVGGINVVWGQCLIGSRTLARIEFIHFAPIVNRVFQVKRKYPTTNPMVRTPVIVKCDAPDYTQVRVTGGCYILNWDGSPDVLACLDAPVAVEQRAWSSVKALFR